MNRLQCSSVEAVIESTDGQLSISIPFPSHLKHAYNRHEAETLMYYKNRAAREEEKLKEMVSVKLESILSEDPAVVLIGLREVISGFNTFKEMLKDYAHELETRLVLETTLDTWMAQDASTDEDQNAPNGDTNTDDDTGTGNGTNDNQPTGGDSGDSGSDTGDTPTGNDDQTP